MSRLKTTLKDPDIDYRLLDERGPTFEAMQRAKEAPLDCAHAKGQIDHKQRAAGQRLYQEYVRSQANGKVKSNDWLAIRGGFGSGELWPLSDTMNASRLVFIKAMEVLGEYQQKRQPVFKIVCEEIPIVEVGQYVMGYRDREYALKHALKALRNGLDLLCKQWGME